MMAAAHKVRPVRKPYILGLLTVASFAAAILPPPFGLEDGTLRTEDAPAWECDRDGNRICGPITVTVRGSVAEVRSVAGLSADVPHQPHASLARTIADLPSECTPGAPSLVLTTTDLRAVIIDAAGCPIAIGTIRFS